MIPREFMLHLIGSCGGQEHVFSDISPFAPRRDSGGWDPPQEEGLQSVLRKTEFGANSWSPGWTRMLGDLACP